ncbi:MAG: hypothetical protein ACREVR_11420, partial [Burkholderiales bacterium]
MSSSPPFAPTPLYNRRHTVSNPAALAESQDAPATKIVSAMMIVPVIFAVVLRPGSHPVCNS